MNREWNARVPYFVRLYSTFQDSERLYFVMTYARNGDLLGFIDKLADSVSYIKIMGISFVFDAEPLVIKIYHYMTSLHLGYRLYSVLCGRTCFSNRTSTFARNHSSRPKARKYFTERANAHSHHRLWQCKTGV